MIYSNIKDKELRVEGSKAELVTELTVMVRHLMEEHILSSDDIQFITKHATMSNEELLNERNERLKKMDPLDLLLVKIMTDAAHGDPAAVDLMNILTSASKEKKNE